MGRFAMFHPHHSVLRTLVAACALLLLPATAVAQRSPVYQQRPTGRPVTALQRRPGTPGQTSASRVLLRGSVRNYVHVVGSDSSIHLEGASALPDHDVPGVDGIGPSDASHDRGLWLPYASNASVRRGLVSAVQRDMHRGSATIERMIDRGNGEPVWDTLIIGGGVYAAATAQGLSSADPGRRVLTVESSASIAPRNETPGTGFAATQREQLQGPSMRNAAHASIGGPVDPSDLVGGRSRPMSDTMSDAATIALHTSGSDVLLRNHVERVEHAPPGMGARYMVTLRNTVTGTRRLVFASNLVVATRVGRQRVALPDAASNRVLQGELDRAETLLAPGADDTDGAMPLALDAHSAPRVMTVAQGLDVARRAPAAYRVASDGAEPAPVTAVVGFGDDAREMVEHLSGEPGNTVHWAVGNEGPSEPDAVRPTMFRGSPGLEASLRRGATQLVRARLVAVRRAVDHGRQRFLLTYDHGFGRRSTELADRVILASELENDSGDVLSGLDARGSHTAQGGTIPRPVVVNSRAVARQLRDESVFFVGPGAEGIVPESAVGASALTTAVEENLPRTTTFATSVLAAEPRADADRNHLLDVSAELDERVRSVVLDAHPTSTGSTKLFRSEFTQAGLPVGYGENFDVALRYEMAETLDAFRFPGGDAVSVTVSPARLGRVDVRVGGAGRQGANHIAAAIARNPRLLALLERNLSRGFRTQFTATLRPPSAPRQNLRGSIAPSTLAVDYGPNSAR